MRRKNIGNRIHHVRFTDQDLIGALRQWMEIKTHTDNPTMRDALDLRDILSDRLEQDLEMLCLSWLRNEMVALRKNSNLKQGEVS